MDGHNADALCARAEAYIDQELFEEGWWLVIAIATLLYKAGPSRATFRQSIRY